MSFAGMNYGAVVAAAVASFVFGGVYYGLLSRQWLAAVGKSLEEVQRTGMALPLVVSGLGLLVMAWVLAGIVGHLGPGQVTLRNGAISGGLCWLGFVVTTIATNHAYGGAKRALTVIDSAHWLGVLLIQGAVIGHLGVS